MKEHPLGVLVSQLSPSLLERFLHRGGRERYRLSHSLTCYKRWIRWRVTLSRENTGLVWNELRTDGDDYQAYQALNMMKDGMSSGKINRDDDQATNMLKLSGNGYNPV